MKFLNRGAGMPDLLSYRDGQGTGGMTQGTSALLSENVAGNDRMWLKALKFVTECVPNKLTSVDVIGSDHALVERIL
jgi:hypothetical protein